jgi:hypothetical protein
MQANYSAGVYLEKELYKKQAKTRHNATWKENTHIQVLSTQKKRQYTCQLNGDHMLRG